MHYQILPWKQVKEVRAIITGCTGLDNGGTEGLGNLLEPVQL